MPHFSRFDKFPAIYAFHMCVEFDKTKQTLSNKIWYDTYIRHILYVYVFPFSVQKRVFELSRVWPWRWPRGVPHTWYLSAQSFITILKLVWREYDILAMNEWKKKCVGLHRTWVSKRTVNSAMEDWPDKYWKCEKILDS